MEIAATLRGLTLLKLIDSGIYPVEADGSVKIERFNAFWDDYHKNLITAFDNELNRQIALIKNIETEEEASTRKRGGFLNLWHR